MHLKFSESVTVNTPKPALYNCFNHKSVVFYEIKIFVNERTLLGTVLERERIFLMEYLPPIVVYVF